MALVSSLVRKKAAIYIRVSTRYQVDKDSLEVQRRELKAYSEMILGISDYVVFEDPGYSAKNTDRPDYQRMMDRLQTGEFSHLLVWKIDRISRNLLDFAEMYSALKRYGVTFVSKNEQFDTSSAVGEAMLKIILVFAELERQMTSERVTAVMLSRAGVGKWNGGRVPYGYQYDKASDTFSVNEYESKVLKMIFDLYEQYHSTLYVTTYLNNKGLKTRAGKDWSTIAVHKMLTNVFYIGDYRYNVRDSTKKYEIKDESEWVTYENHHVPLISREQFQNVQNILKRHKRGGNQAGQSRIRKRIHVFSGVLVCGVCGSNMSASIDRARSSGWRPSIYACRRHRQNITACGNKYISEVVLGPFILNYLSNMLSAKKSVTDATTIHQLNSMLLKGDPFKRIDHVDPADLQNSLHLMSEGQTGLEYTPPVAKGDSNIVSEREVLEERRRRLDSAVNRLKQLYLFGDESVSQADYIVERERLLGELTKVEARLAEIGAQDSPSLDAESEDFVQKASYFVIAKTLTSGQFIEYEKYLRKVEPSVLQNFIHRVISKITVVNGEVTSITFKNGATHHFAYK